MQRQGFAKKQFAEAYQRSPWLSFGKRQSGQPQWPFLDLFLAQQRVAYFDYDLTHRLLRDFPSTGQEVALFLCHLILAAKEGHLCVQASQEGISPSVQHLWQNEEGNPLSIDESRTITQLILEGSKQIPEGLLTILDHAGRELPTTPICQEGNRFYLQRLWVYETLFLKNLKKHLNTPPAITLNPADIKKVVRTLIEDKLVLDEQAQAIMQGCLNPLTLVTGGPGTGKTYTAGHLIKVFWQLLTAEQRACCQIVLAAPTGKAAANLQRSLNKVTGSLEGFPPIQAKTLHSLLGLKHSSPSKDPVRLTADLIVVDESSMIDVRMMAALFESLKPGSRLILLGDKHQLPAVEAGSVFFDLISLQNTYPQLAFPCISLSVCMRAELKGLIDFAQLINQGSSQKVLDTLNQTECHGIKRLSFAEDKKTAQAEFISHVTPLFPTVIHLGQKPDHLLDLFQTIRLLSPVRKGPFGVETLNQLIWQKISHKVPMNGFLAVPIMVTVNDYRQELFNGDTGILIRRLPLHSLCAEDYALFPCRLEEGKVRRFSALLLPKHELAYCLSVHKSQGSEFDHVILALPEGAELFGREVFYTAVTRARKSLEIYGSDLVIQKTVEHQALRLSGLEQRMTTKEWLEG